MTNIIFSVASAPVTFEWSPKCALVMIACNILAYAIARATIRQPNIILIFKLTLDSS